MSAMSYTDPSNRPIDRTIPFSAGSPNGDTHMSTVDNPVETAKLLSELLKEYAGNLGSVVNDLNTAKRKTIVIRTAVVASLILFILTGLAYIFLADNQSALAPQKDVPLTFIKFLNFLALMCGMVAFLAALFSILGTDASGSTRALHRSAAIRARHLSGLIRTTSQFKEHAVLDIARHLELDLRLAEAEATIALYSDVVQKPVQ